MPTCQFAFCSINSDIPAAYSAGSTLEAETVSGTSAATTAAATASQNFCRVATDTACHVVFGSSPTATTANGFFLPANAVEYFRVKENDQGAVIEA